jgi:hypothetical protein
MNGTPLVRLVAPLFVMLISCASEPQDSGRGVDPSAPNESVETTSQAITDCGGCKPGIMGGTDCSSCTCKPVNLSEDCRSILNAKCKSIYPVDCNADGSCSCGPVAKPNNRTCWQACGVYSPTRTCQCDAACSRFGDCCFDKATFCSGCSCAADCSVTKNCCATCF